VSDLWAGLCDAPVYALTSDQDWAPEWALERLLEHAQAAGTPLHVFRTNPSPVLDAAAAAEEITQGWHPNFLPGSTHGATTEEVLAACRALVPQARTARSHCFREDTLTLRALAAAGIAVDSQPASMFQPGLVPLLHESGILRLPVFFEDDLFFRWLTPDLDLAPVLATLGSPGLKILNVHATFFACNVPSDAFYEQVRGRVFGSQAAAEGVVHSGRGTADALRELTAAVHAAGASFTSFEQLVSDVLARVAAQRAELPPPFGTLGLSRPGS